MPYILEVITRHILVATGSGIFPYHIQETARGKLPGIHHVNIEEIRKPEIDAQLIADSITQQLEKRIMFRRAMKRAMQNAMRLGAQGIKIMSSGRLN